MHTTLWKIAILIAVMFSGYLRAGTLEDIQALEAGKTGGRAPALDAFTLPKIEVPPPLDQAEPAITPVWYPLSDGRKTNLRDWTIVLFMQSTCPYCRRFAPILKTFSQQTGLDVFAISLDGRGDAEFPNVLPATPDVMVEYFQSGLPVATPTTFLTNVHTMETWPLLQGAAEATELRNRLDEVLQWALNKSDGKRRSPYSQGKN